MQAQILYTNFFRIAFLSNHQLQVYKFNWEPTLESKDLNQEDGRFLNSLINKSLANCQEFKNDHPHYMCNNFLVYSPKQGKKSYNLPDITFLDKNYKVELEIKGTLDKNSDEAVQLLGRLVRYSIQRFIKLNKLGKKFYDKNDKQIFESHGLELMNGYETFVTMKQNMVLLQVESCIKQIRKENYLEVIKNFQQSTTSEQQEYLGGIVAAAYGDEQFYRVNDIDYNQTPLSKFPKNNGELQSYVDYYKERYNIHIKNPNQPLILSIRKKKGVEQKLYLIPELMRPTGETKRQKSDFRLQKELSRYKHVTANEKNNKIKTFVQLLKKQAGKMMEEWYIDIPNNPIDIPYSVLDAGEIIMANKKLVIGQDDLDRGTQDVMLKMPFGNGIDRLLVLYPRNCKQGCDNFLDTFKQSVTYMNFRINAPPRVVEIDEDREQLNGWLNQIDANKGAQIIICILNGPKKKGKFYNELKVYCSKIGQISQMVLESTIKNKKGLRTVCNKIVLKITSKCGGVPYTISGIPDRFVKRPTMVGGIAVTKKGNDFILSLVVTIDKEMGRYISNHKLLTSESEISQGLNPMIRDAINKFGQYYRTSPEYIVMYRGGISQGQLNQVRENEINGILQGIQHWGQRTKNTAMAYIIVNQSNSSKFYSSNNGNIDQLQSCKPGTLIKGTVINDNCTDYQLISQLAKQGVASSTYYRIIHNEISGDLKDEQKVKASINDLQILTYKLCHLYYNSCQSIKIPAPAKLAQRLSQYVADKYDPKKPQTLIMNNDEIQKYQNLYFI